MASRKTLASIVLAIHRSTCNGALVRWTWMTRMDRMVGWLRPVIAYLPALLVSGMLAYASLSAIVQHVGHPAVPLDDAFIHFQFARNLAAGRFFQYMPGEGYVAGATSFLWPLLLAPFYLIGFRGLSILWVAWFFGFLALAGVFLEVFRLTEKLTGRAVALGASAMCAFFGAFTWFAASGMETMALAWVLLRGARLAAEWFENPETRSQKSRNHLILLGIIAPGIRPEGAMVSLFAAIALLISPFGTGKRQRALGALPLLGLLFDPVIHLMLTGSTTSNTTAVKWLPANPYYGFRELWDTVGYNLRVFFQVLLDGQQWSAVFLPRGTLPFALLALGSIPLMGWRSQRPWRAGLVFFIALGMMIPCTYHTFLWNRLRYLWPFAPAWFIGMACFTKLAGQMLSLVRPRWGLIAPMLAGIVAGVLAGNMKWTVDDLVKSAAAIDLQQVELGRWAKENLPAEAIIGVNDTGAIAYLSERRTFDVIGLTTQGEGRYWVAGAGSRFEHYERLYASEPHRFPTHFIVYPHWMACEPVLGKRLHEASVYDQTILGGTTMVVYEARVDLLGSGARPILIPYSGEIIDELDVADLESEQAHAYEIAHGGKDEANKVHTDFFFEDRPGGIDSGQDENTSINDRIWADGGRFERVADRFVAHLRPGQPAKAIARWVGAHEGEVELEIKSGSTPLVTIRLGAYRAQENEFIIPAQVASEHTPIEVRALHGGTFGSLHYWFVAQ
jgi:hypothetical protein